VVVGLRPRGAMAELAGIRREADGGLYLGALTTIRAVERDPRVQAALPALAQAAARVASPRIRNQATLGGLLAHADPAADITPVLLALDASVEVAGPGGVRRVAVADLARDVFETELAPDELLVGVHVPPVAASARLVSVAFRPRTSEDYATVSVAVRLERDGAGAVTEARIALGSVAGTAVRARAAEAALVGGSADAAAIEAASRLVAEAISPGDDARGSADYKARMARVWTARALAQAASAPNGLAA
jgi:carbon-monoxide dehydrogenase medium subunit